jgi:hypothetical protein
MDASTYNSPPPPRGFFSCMARFNKPIEPMALGNTRANGVRSLDVCCWQCHHRAGGE